VVLAADGAGRVPHQVLTACRQRLLLRLSDGADYAALGVAPSAVPDLVAGRGVTSDGATLVQLARPARGLAAEVAACSARWPAVPVAERPSPVSVLPRLLDLGVLELPGHPLATIDADGGLHLTVGVADRGLRLARLVLAPGAHGLVAGPPRSGRTTALATIARSAAGLGRAVLWVRGDGVTGEVPDGLVACGPGEALTEAVAEHRPILVAVDDADLLLDDGDLAALVRARTRDRHVVVAGRADRLRAAYGSWAKEVGVDRSGVLLDPDRDLDGDLLGVRLPRQLPVAPRLGLAWVTGEPGGFAQIARPRLSDRHLDPEPDLDI